MDTCIALSQKLLLRTHYEVKLADDSCLIFEDISVVGAVFSFKSAESLLNEWLSRQTKFLNRYGSNLRKAPEKVWNLYAIFLTSQKASAEEARRISALEEDFRATRKLACAEITSEAAATKALLPLLPLQAEVSLGAPDVEEELRGRLELSASASEILFQKEDSKLLARALLEEYS